MTRLGAKSLRRSRCARRRAQRIRNFKRQEVKPRRRYGASRRLAHGLFCVGCCWALMLLLFAGGSCVKRLPRSEDRRPAARTKLRTGARGRQSIRHRTRRTLRGAVTPPLTRSRGTTARDGGREGERVGAVRERLAPRAPLRRVSPHILLTPPCQSRSEPPVHAEGDRGAVDDGLLHLVGDAAVGPLRLVGEVGDVEGERERGAQLVGDAEVDGVVACSGTGSGPRWPPSSS